MCNCEKVATKVKNTKDGMLEWRKYVSKMEVLNRKRNCNYKPLDAPIEVLFLERTISYRINFIKTYQN